MVTTRATAHDALSVPIEDMTDSQIQLLLSQTAERLSSQTRQKAPDQTQDSPRLVFPKLNPGTIADPYTSTGQGGIVRMNDDVGGRVATSVQQNQGKISGKSHTHAHAHASGKSSGKVLGIRKVEDPVAVRNRAEEAKKATAGTQWFNLPKTDLTPELKRDLQLIKMRNVLDPHRHYKKDGGSKLKAPEYSQVGTIVEGPTEYFSARLQNKDRKQTFVEQVLEGEKENGRFGRKYGEIQTKKASGKKNFYKAFKAKRTGAIKKR